MRNSLNVAVDSDETSAVLVYPILITSSWLRNRPQGGACIGVFLLVGLCWFSQPVVPPVIEGLAGVLAASGLAKRAVSNNSYLLCATMSTMLCLCTVIAMLVNLDNRLIMTQHGILIPLWMLPTSGFRRSLLWSDLKAISLGTAPRKRTLLLSFRGGKSLELDLRKFDERDFWKLMETLDTKCSICESAPERQEIIEAYQTATGNRGTLTKTSFTALWLEDADRFAMSPFVSLEPGHRLQDGSYVIEQQIGSGGFSSVYLAHNRERKSVVLKEVVVGDTIECEAARTAEEQFHREAALLAKLSHPQVVGVLDHFVENDRNYVVLERVEGQDLRAIASTESVTAETALDWMAQIAGILRYLHEREVPIIHRDISPDNIIRAHDGKLMLIDFGAANDFSSKATGTLVGKQAYMAPEQVRGQACPQSDLYGLGATISFCLNGVDPKPISEQKVPANVSGLQRELFEMIALLTRVETSSRISSAEILLQGLLKLKGVSDEQF